MRACRPPNEEERLAALHRYDILDTPMEEAFDDITRLAARICEAPIAVINLVDRDRQFFKSEIGLGVRETPLDVSLCAHAILQPGLFIVPDTHKDERFAGNPLVTGAPYLRFYAGALLETPDGHALGTLCVLDYTPRDLSGGQKDALAALARQVMTQMELRRLYAREKRIAETLQRSMLIKPQAAAFAGLEVEPVYEAAWDEAQVGGDFFDAFALPDGKVALVVGDVSGKGLVAAAHTAKVKFALRVYLRESPSPSEALSRLNEYLQDTQDLDGADRDTFVALALAIVDQASGAAALSWRERNRRSRARASGRVDVADPGGYPWASSGTPRTRPRRSAWTRATSSSC